MTTTTTTRKGQRWADVTLLRCTAHLQIVPFQHGQTLSHTSVQQPWWMQTTKTSHWKAQSTCNPICSHVIKKNRNSRLSHFAHLFVPFPFCTPTAQKIIRSRRMLVRRHLYEAIMALVTRTMSRSSAWRLSEPSARFIFSARPSRQS